MVWTCSDRECNPGRQTLSCYCWVKSTGKDHEEGRPVGRYPDDTVALEKSCQSCYPNTGLNVVWQSTFTLPNSAVVLCIASFQVFLF